MQPGPLPLSFIPPDHLVERTVRTGWRRVGVGTAPFNIVSFGILVGLSSFIVHNSNPSIDGQTISAQNSAASPAAAGSGKAGAHRARPSHTQVTTTTAALAAPMQVIKLASASPPVESFTDAKGHGTKPFVPVPTTRPKPVVAKPAAPHVTTCDSFTTQPAAQAAFDADRAGLAGLDGDGDGVACEHLPGRPNTPAPPQVPAMAQLLRPYTRLYGVHTPNAPYRASELADFTAAAGGKAPNTLMFFTNFAQPFPTDAITTSWNDGALPLVTLEPIVQDSTTGQPTLADIATGKWDTYLSQWATAAKAQGQPLALRFGQEMNGDWYPWSDGKLGNKAGDFIAAWRHVHDVFDRQGVTNVIWVWSVNRVDNLYDKTLTRVYPGDRFVDWAGISGYYRTAVAGVAPSFDGTFAATLAELKRVAPSKLVMLTEVGAGTTLENRTAWIKSFFAGLLDHPEVIGFTWFNDFKDGGDWRIQYAQQTAAAFAAGVADLRYGSLVHQATPAPASPASLPAPTQPLPAPAQPLPPVTPPPAPTTQLVTASATKRTVARAPRSRPLRRTATRPTR